MMRIIKCLSPRRCCLRIAFVVASAITLQFVAHPGPVWAEEPYQVAWVRQFGTAAQDVGRGLAAAGDGNVYVTGYTKGALAAPNPSGQDAPFFAKYDADGNSEWIRQLPNNVAGFQGGKVATDDLGNVFLTTSPGGGLTSPVFPNRLHNYDADGNVKWSADFPLPQNGAGVVADDLGYAYVSTYEVISEYPGNGYEIINLRKFDPQTGSTVWTRSLHVGGSPNNTSGVSYDGLGNIYVAAYTSGSLIEPNAGGTDGLVAKYTLDGEFVWARQFGSSANDNNFQVAADAIGNVWSTGGTFGDLGGPYQGTQDVYLAKHDADGNLQWIRHLGTAGEETSGKIWADGLGHVYLATSTNSLLGSQGFGSDDIVVAKYDADGNQLWLKQFGTSGSDLPSGGGITGDAMGNLYITGYTTASWGGINAGGQDVVLIKLSPAVSLAGDYNANGTVDAADYVVWRNGLATGAYTQADYDRWRARFGQTAVTGSGATAGPASSANAAAPEPGARVLILCGLASALCIARSRQPKPRDPRHAIEVTVTARQIHKAVFLHQRTDGYLTRFDASGNVIWSLQFGTSGHGEGDSISSDGAGNVRRRGDRW